MPTVSQSQARQIARFPPTSPVSHTPRSAARGAILEGAMVEICNICEGAGLRVVERADGTRMAQPCVCRSARKTLRMIEQARIPQRYMHCTLESYETLSSPSLNRALVQARNFVKAYPFDTGGNGLLLTGSIGVGKTHLAVGMFAGAD